MEATHYLTADGLIKLEKRLAYLKEDRRTQMAERLRLILEEGGGLDQSPEYVEAKHEQALLESEIARLEAILSHACIIETASNNDVIRLGSQVTIVEEGCSEDEVYQLVDPVEANPREGKISIASPLGRVLLGACVDECVCVAAPDGDMQFVVKAIH